MTLCIERRILHMSKDANDQIEQKIKLHHAFWNRDPLQRPLVTFYLGPDFFFSRHYRAAEHLLIQGKRITPDMLNVDLFLEDYDRMFAAVDPIEQDGFWATQPYTGIPWMEGILGCEIYATASSFISRPWVQSLSEVDQIVFNPDNPWFKKYIEFLRKLAQLAAGRFPVGQPIMRGPSDMVGALLGQSEMIYAIMDEPDKMKRLFEKVTRIFLEMMKHHYEIVPEFKGGYSLGFYPVWAPGKCIWFQEDLSAILSPDFYREFLKIPAEQICRGYDYTAVHLHPASFFIVDQLLQIEKLRVIEVNKDIGGPSVEEMTPVFQKILAQKNLILWGDLSIEDAGIILRKLPARGIFLNVVVQDADQARALFHYLKDNS